MDDLFSEFSDVPVKPVPKTEKVYKAAEVKPSPAVLSVKKEDAEHHPARRAPYKVEKAYTSTSMGGEITEGCIEHYSERIIALDNEIEEDTSLLSELFEDDIEKYIIMSEILTPKFKR